MFGAPGAGEYESCDGESDDISEKAFLEAGNLVSVIVAQPHEHRHQGKAESAGDNGYNSFCAVCHEGIISDFFALR
jgi:cytochrome c5